MTGFFTTSVDEGSMYLETVDLLPKRFRERRRVYRIACAWSALAMASFAILVGTIAAFWAHARRIESRQSQLLADAAPLWQVRQDVTRMQNAIGPLRRSCALVETARPRDELVQCLAAVAVASQDPDGDISVETIEVRLPLEFDATAKSRPEWAQPMLSITATVSDEQSSKRWLDRMNASDRIVDAVIQSDVSGPLSAKTALVAKPVAMGDLP